MKRAVIEALTPDIPDERLLTPKDLAAITAVDVTTARELIAQATIPGGVRIGPQLRIPAGAVRAWQRQTQLPRNPDLLALRRKARAL